MDGMQPTQRDRFWEKIIDDQTFVKACFRNLAARQSVPSWQVPGSAVVCEQKWDACWVEAGTLGRAGRSLCISVVCCNRSRKLLEQICSGGRVRVTAQETWCSQTLPSLSHVAFTSDLFSFRAAELHQAWVFTLVSPTTMQALAPAWEKKRGHTRQAWRLHVLGGILVGWKGTV